jgi:hypothetical protein
MHAITTSLSLPANEEPMIYASDCQREDECRLFQPCAECGNCTRLALDAHDGLCVNYEPYLPEYDDDEYERLVYERDSESELVATVDQN